MRAAEHSIIALGADTEPELADGDAIFHDTAELRRATAEWAITRLVALWNGLPGVTPIRKFTDRATAVKRIWNALQDVVPNTAVASEVTASQAAEAKPRAGTKKEQLLALLARSDGATIAEVMAALGWQSHSVRGCLSTLAKKGLGIHSFHRPTGERAYSTAPLNANPEVM